MPIVLAIEPDRRQASHLVAIVRQQVGAELILADTTEGALDAIGDRVPDLVLVPALLSPQDDAALAAALRVIAAAAHVRTLTIPVLANGVKRATPGGMLAKWRRSRAASPEPEGCDPAVFGEQIATYLQEAAAEREEFVEEPFDVYTPLAVAPAWMTPAILEPPVAIDPIVTPEPAAATQPISPGERQGAIAPIVEPEPPAAIEVAALVEVQGAVDPVVRFAPPVLEPIAPAETQVAADPVVAFEPPAAMPPIALVEDPVVDEEPFTTPVEPPPADADRPWSAPADSVEEQVIDLSDELTALSDEAGDELAAGDPVGVYTIADDAADDAAETSLELTAFDLLPAILEPEGAALHAAPPAALSAAPAEWIDPPEPPRADIQPWVPLSLTPGRLWPTLEGMPVEAPARTEQPDWIELVASLRQDLERRRTDPAPAVAAPPAARPSEGPESERRPVAKQKSPAKKAKPTQDEWGFFDPEQCGFSTLLAKLEEITKEELRG